MENRVIHIWGGAGSIGSELVRQLAISGNELTVLDIDETRMFDLVEELRLDGLNVRGFVADVRDKEFISNYMQNNSYPDYVINAAARKHVTPMEDTPMEAVSTNIGGVFNLINFCNKYHCKLIQISTDKVVNAACIMGATKKVAELMVRNARYVSVRFGNVMGSRGSVIPIWQKQMEQGKPLTVTDERMERYMMTIEEACSLVIEAAQMEDVEGKVVCLDMGARIKILDLAKEILKRSGMENIRPDGSIGDSLRMIGMRQGEQLVERLMTEDEEESAEKRGKFWIW